MTCCREASHAGTWYSASGIFWQHDSKYVIISVAEELRQNFDEYFENVSKSNHDLDKHYNPKILIAP